MKPYYESRGITLYVGDVREVLPQLDAELVHCCVTSPPYWGLRDYGVSGQIGLEPTPAGYLEQMTQVFSEVKRVLRGDGTLWLNMGDSYCANRGNTLEKPGFDNKAAQGNATLAIRQYKIGGDGLKEKDLCGIPWQLAFSLRSDGWYLRSDIIWHKPNPMPESVTDRPTKAHEYIFLMSKAERYYYDGDAIAEATNWPDGSWGRSKCYDGDNTGKLRSFYGNGAQSKGGETRNKRTVWTVATCPFPEAHFATFPTDLIKPCILAGCPAGGIVLDPFAGAGTTMLVARENNCRAIGIELNEGYAEMTAKRLSQEVLDFSGRSG